MGEPERRRSRRVRQTAASGAPWKDAATALLPVLACFLGGATEKWAEGIVVALLGALLLANPPRMSLGWWFNGVTLVLVGWAAFAFLPASWLPIPPWRSALVNDFGAKLPTTLSPQPWLTAGCLASFIAGLAWLYYVSAQQIDNRNARRQLRIFSAGVIALAALSICLYLAKAALPFWHNQRGFGPFPNRNQTGDLLGISAIVIMACGHEDFRHGNKRWILWLAGLAIALAALVLNFSRAGLAILVIGSACWTGVLVLRSGSAARIATGLSALLVLLTAVLVFGGKTLERFNFRGGDGAGVATDFRWLIFRDALELIRASPWCGIGLGNFSPIFALFRHASVEQNRALHPESDWLWFAAEVGWPGVLLVVAGAALLVRRVFPLAAGTSMLVRVSAFTGAVLFALHGLVDVSGHRVGSAYAGLLLFGLALARPLNKPLSTSTTVVFRALGLLLFGIGTAWAIAAWRDLPLPGGIGVDREKRLTADANKRRAFSETIEHASHGLAWAPLEWQLYFLRAIGKVGAGRAREDALQDFRLARYLEPGSYEVPYQEGVTWIKSDPVPAMTAWREALRRAGTERAALYWRMWSAASLFNPGMLRMLQDLGNAQPELALTYLERSNADQFTPAVNRLLERDPALSSLTNEQKAKLFTLWSERGDRGRLVQLVNENPALLELAWRGVAQHRAGERDFRGAVELAQHFGRAPKLPQVQSDESLEQLQQKIYGSLNNYETGFALYGKQMAAGRVDEALITLRRYTEQPSCPAYFHFLEAESWAVKENWERAWAAWVAYDRASGGK